MTTMVLEAGTEREPFRKREIEEEDEEQQQADEEVDIWARSIIMEWRKDTDQDQELMVMDMTSWQSTPSNKTKWTKAHEITGIDKTFRARLMLSRVANIPEHHTTVEVNTLKTTDTLAQVSLTTPIRDILPTRHSILCTTIEAPSIQEDIEAQTAHEEEVNE